MHSNCLYLGPLSHSWLPRIIKFDSRRACAGQLTESDIKNVYMVGMSLLCQHSIENNKL